MIKALIYISAFVFTYFGVEAFRRWGINRDILDIPNERSSHDIPTPRGGGLVIVFVSLISFLIYQLIYSETFIWSYLMGGLLIALISWLDDIYSLPIAVRFFCHFLATALIILQFGYWETLYLPSVGEMNLGLVGLIFTTLWIVWVTNAYNFMDGIDGIAGIQAVTASIGWGLVGWLLGIEIYLYFGVILFVASLGFLIHNWHPAKIFMGDVGSAFLGFTFAVFPFLASFEDVNSEVKVYLPIIALSFVWLFVFDTTLTFTLRLLRREKVWKAHRKHLYQLLVIENMSHSTVSIIYGFISIFIVFCVIFCLFLYDAELLLITLISMVTLILVLVVFCKTMLTKDSQNVNF